MGLVDERARVAVAGQDHRLRREQQRSGEVFAVAEVTGESDGLLRDRERIIGTGRQQTGCRVESAGDLPALLVGQPVRRADHLVPKNREFEITQLLTDVQAVALEQDVARRRDQRECVGLSSAVVQRRCRERRAVFPLGVSVGCLHQVADDRLARRCISVLDEQLEPSIDRLLSEFRQPDHLVIHPVHAVDAGVCISDPESERLVEQTHALLVSGAGLLRLPHHARELIGVDLRRRVEHIAMTDPTDDVAAERRAESGQGHPQRPVGARVVRPDVEQDASLQRDPAPEREPKCEQELAALECGVLAVDANAGSAQHLHLDHRHLQTVVRSEGPEFQPSHPM